jgi:hypothetical protein
MLHVNTLEGLEGPLMTGWLEQVGGFGHRRAAMGARLTALLEVKTGRQSIRPSS